MKLLLILPVYCSEMRVLIASAACLIILSAIDQLRKNGAMMQGRLIAQRLLCIGILFVLASALMN